jgi:hypothetical protein
MNGGGFASPPVDATRSNSLATKGTVVKSSKTDDDVPTPKRGAFPVSPETLANAPRFEPGLTDDKAGSDADDSDKKPKPHGGGGTNPRG